jgi:hypothetical protein
VKRMLIVGALVALTVGLVVQPEHPSHAERPVAGVQSSEQTIDAPPGVIGELIMSAIINYIHAVDMANVATYVAAVQQANVVTYVNAVAEAEAQAYQASRAVQEARPQQQVAAVPDVGGGGSCYGGPIPDYIVDRESGGNPNALNPSGAFGCFQIMPEWWSGSCSGFDKYSIEGQKQCAALIWDGGAGSGNWALTR